MNTCRHILCLILLLTVSLSSVAEDSIRVRSCRRGTPRPLSMSLTRGASGGQSRQAGGDFYHGDRRQLTVLVAFNDCAFKGDEAATIQQWNKILNAENLTETPFKGSVHDYFSAQSYGDFNVTFDLQYVVLGDSYIKYRSWDKGYGDADDDDENSQYLVKDIMEVLKTRDIDWSLYDWNGDGFVNQLLIVYAGKGMNDGGEGVYCDPIPVNDGSKQYLVDCYCALAELTGKNDYGSFGTVCHEYSHCFGLPDFYYGSTTVVGGWDLMDYGNYSGDGYCPPGYSAHERWLMGWLTPTELTESATVTNMPQLSEQPVAYLVRNDGWENEYYFIENRQQTGWDSSIPGHGVVVFHIDFDPSVWTSTTVTPNSLSYKRYTIFPANNKTSLSYKTGWTYPYNGNNQLTNESTPAAKLNHINTDDSKLMNKPVTNIAVTAGLASFDFMGGALSGICNVHSTSNSQSLLFYTLDGRRVTNPTKGIYVVNGKKVVLK